MCGIIGGNLFENEDKLTQGLQSMMHRGTDGNVIRTLMPLTIRDNELDQSLEILSKALKVP